MSRSIESIGKTKELAIENGLKKLNTTLEEVDIEILQEGTRGLFGLGSKPYIVQLRVRQEEPVLRHGQFPVEETQPLRKTLDEDQERRHPDAHQTTRSGRNDASFLPYTEGESHCIGAEFLDGLLKRMNLDASISYAETTDTLRLRLKSEYMGILIGHRGETLDALQYLTNLAVNRNSEQYIRVYLDMENYRSKRETTLIKLAKKTAKEVVETGDTICLEPMNPYERRIFHSSLQGIKGIVTYSEGEEPSRYVVIAPKE